MNTKRRKRRKRRKPSGRHNHSRPINSDSDEADDPRGCMYHLVMASSSSRSKRTYSCVMMTVLCLCTLSVFIYAFRVSRRHELAAEEMSKYIHEKKKSHRPEALFALDGFSYSFTEAVDVDPGAGGSSSLVTVVHPRSEKLYMLGEGVVGRSSFCCSVSVKTDAAAEELWGLENVCENGHVIQSYVVERRIHAKIMVPPMELSEPTTLVLSCEFVWDRPVASELSGDTDLSDQLTN